MNVDPTEVEGGARLGHVKRPTERGRLGPSRVWTVVSRDAHFDDEVVAATWVVDGSGVYGSIDLRHEATLRIVVIAARHGIADFGSTGMIGWIEVHKSVLARLEHS
jgi:hypothetical protein